MKQIQLRKWLPALQVLLFVFLNLLALRQPGEIHAPAEVSWACQEDMHVAERSALSIAVVLDAPGAAFIPFVLPFVLLLEHCHAYRCADIALTVGWGIGVSLQWYLIGFYFDHKRGLARYRQSQATLWKRAAFGYGMIASGVGVLDAAYTLSEAECFVMQDVVVAATVVGWAVVAFVALMHWRNSWLRPAPMSLLG